MVRESMDEKVRAVNPPTRWSGWLVGGLAVLVAVWGCAGTVTRRSASTAHPKGPGVGPQEETGGTEAAAPAKEPGQVGPEVADAGSGDELEVSGVGGTIDEAAVAKAFSSKRYRIERCILGYAKPMTYLEGSMIFQFTVYPNGRTTFRLVDDDLGHHRVEACLLKVVRTVKLGRPKGGKVKITYPLQIPNRGTPHVRWSKRRIRRLMRKYRSAIMSCRKRGRPRHFTVTMYILPGGRLGSLGVFSPKVGAADEFAACVEGKLKGVAFPDPLGKVAKVRYKF